MLPFSSIHPFTIRPPEFLLLGKQHLMGFRGMMRPQDSLGQRTYTKSSSLQKHLLHYLTTHHSLIVSKLKICHLVHLAQVQTLWCCQCTAWLWQNKTQTAEFCKVRFNTDWVYGNKTLEVHRRLYALCRLYVQSDSTACSKHQMSSQHLNTAWQHIHMGSKFWEHGLPFPDVDICCRGTSQQQAAHTLGSLQLRKSLSTVSS